MWSGRKTREQLDRLEQSIGALARAVQDHHADYPALSDRLGTLEQHISGMATSANARNEETVASLDGTDTAVRGALTKVAGSLKGLRRHGKGLSQDVNKLLVRLARLNPVLDASMDAQFLDVAQPLVETRRTMCGYDRLFTLWQAACNVAHLDLPAVEVGTFRGGSAALLAQALRTFGGAERELHVVDTFEGHLDSTFSERDLEQQRGKFRGTSYSEVREYLAAFPGIRVHQGDAAGVVRSWPERRYSLVHIDVDLYRPTLECLEYFAPRLVDGGVIIMDDYDAPTCPGVRQALEEYAGRERVPVFQTWRLQVEQAVLVKRPATF